MNDDSSQNQGRWIRPRSGARWLLHYGWIIILVGIVLALILRPTVYGITHYNAKDCGSLVTYGSYTPTSNTVGQQEIGCFVQSHEHCEAATLFQTSQGVEGAGKLAFRTANSLGGCVLSVIGYEEGFCVIPLYCQLVPFIDSDCRTLQPKQDGLHFLNCGNRADINFII